MVELLSPVGDMDCLKAAVQNGADCVYFGGPLFNARASASNFDREGLKEAIHYAKLRNVKINFTLNTLLKDDEFDDAVDLAKYVYSLGVDAIIVQDLGLAKYLIENFPDMAVHASTQMTAHNLQGVLALQNLGFKRVVLSREVALSEIEYICSHSKVEIETFIHGALCISYSGQCLISSAIGGRSGNRGRCAQACRLPYELLRNNESIDKGYLLSPKDLCGLKFIPDLIKAGVNCFKIEGRMKPPEYVATVTRIYRKYINLALSDEPYEIDDYDFKQLMLAFNRGGFSDGNFNDEPNTQYVYKTKPNNMGLYIGNISKINSNHGLITFTTKEPIKIGDNISVEHEEHKYTVSELMANDQNIPEANPGSMITIGRIKGNLSLGDKIYKLSSNTLSKEIMGFIVNENKKIPLSCIATIKKGMPIALDVYSLDRENGSYFSMSSHKESELLPVDSINSPITSERISAQINKTNDTQFEFKSIKIILDDNTFIPKISVLNELRRDCIADLQEQAIKRFSRKTDNINNVDSIVNNNLDITKNNNKKISLLLNELNDSFDYNKIDNVDNIYIPLKFFLDKKFEKILKILTKHGNLYIYFPTIIKDNFRNLFFTNIDSYINDYNVKGLVISNISGIEFMVKYAKKLDIISKYTLNVFNTYTINELKHLGINRVTLSPELDKYTLQKLANSSSLPTEFMVYGRLPLMNTGYCPIGSSNKCYPTCTMGCRDNNAKYYLKDRLGYKFRIIPDNMQTITTVYNSKITSIKHSEFNFSSVLISILDEDTYTINEIISNVKKDIPFSGEEYTNGNLNKTV